MELCASTPNRLSTLTSFASYTRTSPQWKFSPPLKHSSISPNNSVSHYCKYSRIKAMSSEETSTGSNQFVKDEPAAVDYSSVEATNPEDSSNGANQHEEEESDGVVTVDEEESDGVVTVEEVQSEKSDFGGFGLFKDDAAADEQFPQFDFLKNLNMELDFEDSFSIALLGVGGVTALWVTASIIGAIDKIPLFPKLMEVVGLGYTIWFSTRYLLFKKNRDELASKIEEIKQEVLGQKK